MANVTVAAEIIDQLTGIIAILSAVALPIGLGMYMGIRSLAARHQERMEMIKQGIIPTDAKSTPNRYRSLRNGFLCMGIALGTIVGLVASSLLQQGEDNDFLIIGASILLFLGIAYTSFYMITKDKKGFDDEIE